MPSFSKHPLKQMGVEALTAAGLSSFRLPSRLGGFSIFSPLSGEIAPFFLFTPHLKWGAIYTGGGLGLRIAGVDDFVIDRDHHEGPSFSIHTANFPGDLARYITPEEAAQGALTAWAREMYDCLRQYPMSVEDLRAQLQSGRIGPYRADQQLTCVTLSAAFTDWIATHGIQLPEPRPVPIQFAPTPDLRRLN
jgi:hypothetical protein